MVIVGDANYDAGCAESLSIFMVFYHSSLSIFKVEVTYLLTAHTGYLLSYIL